MKNLRLRWSIYLNRENSWRFYFTLFWNLENRKFVDENSLNSKYGDHIVKWNSLRCEGIRERIFGLERNGKVKLWSGSKPRISWKNCFAIRASSAWLRREREMKTLFRIYPFVSSPSFAYSYSIDLLVKTINLPILCYISSR